MSKTPLAKYLKKTSQVHLAEAVGLTQGAISKMLRVGRNVYVVADSRNEQIKLVEEKVIAPIERDSAA